MEHRSGIMRERSAAPVGPALLHWYEGRQYRPLFVGEFFSACHVKKLTRSMTGEQIHL
jgi:hypothetical protein